MPSVDNDSLRFGLMDFVDADTIRQVDNAMYQIEQGAKSLRLILSRLCDNRRPLAQQPSIHEPQEAVRG